MVRLFKVVMQKANHIIWGVVAGVIFPAVAWFLVADRWSTVPYLGKPGVPYLIAIGLNLFLLRYAYKKEADQFGTGLMLSTFAFMLAAFILKIKH